MSIQVDDVIKVLSKIYNFIEDDNIVNEENILNYETDDIEPIRVRIYTESNKFDIFKTKLQPPLCILQKLCNSFAIEHQFLLYFSAYLFF